MIGLYRGIRCSLLGCLLMVQVGCSFAPSEASLSEADYGAPSTSGSMKAQADAFLGLRLKDPESKQVTWGRSGKAWLFRGWINGGSAYGYGLSANVNAKNSYGGYTGFKPYFFFFQDDILKNGGVIQSNMYGFVGPSSSASESGYSYDDY